MGQQVAGSGEGPASEVQFHSWKPVLSNKACKNPDPPPPTPREGKAAPSFLKRTPPQPNRPLISAGPELPACGKFSAAPHPRPHILL